MNKLCIVIVSMIASDAIYIFLAWKRCELIYKGLIAIEENRILKCLDCLYNGRSHFGENSEAADTFYFGKSSKLRLAYRCSTSHA